MYCKGEHPGQISICPWKRSIEFCRGRILSSHEEAWNLEFFTHVETQNFPPCILLQQTEAPYTSSLRFHKLVAQGLLHQQLKALYTSSVRPHTSSFRPHSFLYMCLCSRPNRKHWWLIQCKFTQFSRSMPPTQILHSQSWCVCVCLYINLGIVGKWGHRVSSERGWERGGHQSLNRKGKRPQDSTTKMLQHHHQSRTRSLRISNFVVPSQTKLSGLKKHPGLVFRPFFQLSWVLVTTTTILTNQDEDHPPWSRLSLTSLRNSDQVNTFGRLKKS